MSPATQPSTVPAARRAPTVVLIPLFLALGLALAAGCGGEDGASGATTSPDPFRHCLDDEGRVDCDRPGCSAHPFCGGASRTSDRPTDGPATSGPPTTDEPTTDEPTPTPPVSGVPTTDEPTPTSPVTDEPVPTIPETDPPPTTCAVPDLTAAAPDAPVVRSCTSTVRLVAPSASEVRIIAQWQDFDLGTAPALDRADDGSWFLDIDLPPGEYGFKFVLDGVVEEALPPDVPTRWNGGFENRNLIVRDCNLPDARVLEARSNDCAVAASILLHQPADGATVTTVQATVRGVPVESTFDAATGLVQVRAGDLPHGKHTIRVTATDDAGRALEDGLVFIPLWVEPRRWTWQDGLMYLIFIDRFRDSEHDSPNPVGTPVDGVPAIANYMGGDFRGLLDAMREDWFDDLGVDILWLSPIQQNPDGAYDSADRQNLFTGFHGYWPTEPRGLQYRYGDREADADTRFRELMAESHDRGIRILKDVVLNHVHEDHTYVLDFPEWFTAEPCVCTSMPGPCNWDTNPLFCWFMEYLPDLDFRNHAIVQQVIDDVLWWITEYDLDGFRLDAAKHMDHVIMRRLRYEIDRRFGHGGDTPHFYIVGETYTGEDGHGLIMDYVAPWELDGQFDFPLLYPIRRAFIENGSFRNLAERVAFGREQYGDAMPWMSPFFGNHDIPRFASRISHPAASAWEGYPDPMKQGLGDTQWNIINRTSLAAAFTLTQEGIPLLYYGDELALAGAADPDNRRMMDFEPFLSDAQREMLRRTREIGQARRAHSALRHGTWRELWVDDDLLVYARDEGGGSVAIVAMNKGARRELDIPIPTELGLDGVTLIDLLGTPRVLSVQDGEAFLGINDWEYVIWGTP